MENKEKKKANANDFMKFAAVMGGKDFGVQHGDNPD